MSYTQKELAVDIRVIFEDLDSKGQAWHSGWIAKAIMADKQPALDLDHPSADFWTYCAHQFVKNAVRQAGNDLNEDETHNAQLVLPGFERVHLQARYSVTRDGDEVFVAVMDLTDDEIEERAQFYERQSKTMLAHADELRRFMLWRSVRAVRSA